jgi:hypothetical protein
MIALQKLLSAWDVSQTSTVQSLNLFATARTLLELCKSKKQSFYVVAPNIDVAQELLVHLHSLSQICEIDKELIHFFPDYEFSFFSPARPSTRRALK